MFEYGSNPGIRVIMDDWDSEHYAMHSGIIPRIGEYVRLFTVRKGAGELMAETKGRVKDVRYDFQQVREDKPAPPIDHLLRVTLYMESGDPPRDNHA